MLNTYHSEVRRLSTAQSHNPLLLLRLTRLGQQMCYKFDRTVRTVHTQSLQ